VIGPAIVLPSSETSCVVKFAYTPAPTRTSFSRFAFVSLNWNAAPFAFTLAETMPVAALIAVTEQQGAWALAAVANVQQKRIPKLISKARI
jgi:hypothetical protein